MKLTLFTVGIIFLLLIGSKNNAQTEKNNPYLGPDILVVDTPKVSYQYFVKMPIELYYIGRDTIVRSFQGMASDFDLPENVRKQLYHIRMEQVFNQIKRWDSRILLDSIKIPEPKKK